MAVSIIIFTLLVWILWKAHTQGRLWAYGLVTKEADPTLFKICLTLTWGIFLSFLAILASDLARTWR